MGFVLDGESNPGVETKAPRISKCGAHADRRIIAPLGLHMIRCIGYKNPSFGGLDGESSGLQQIDL